MKKSTKTLFTVIIFVIIASVLCSALFVITEADHHCSGANCNICRVISLCLDNMNVLSLLSVIIICICAVIGALNTLISINTSAVIITSPVLKKVKLSI